MVYYEVWGGNNEINIKTKDPEFLDWKWIEINKLPTIEAQSNTSSVYDNIFERIGTIGNNMNVDLYTENNKNQYIDNIFHLFGSLKLLFFFN